jgi:hypothetical protein
MTKTGLSLERTNYGTRSVTSLGVYREGVIQYPLNYKMGTAVTAGHNWEPGKKESLG